MRILVTGANGFIGSRLTVDLSLHGHTVIPVDRGDGDLTHEGVADKLVRHHRPEIVVHLAASVGRLLAVHPAQTLLENLGATAYVADACATFGARLVYCSSSEAYGDCGNGLITETTVPGRDHNLYGVTKRQGEEIARLYAPHNLLIVRPTMPYGPGVTPGYGKMALVNILWQALNREPIIVHAGAERSWCWVDDTSAALAMLIDRHEDGVWNVGRDDDARTMVEVAEIACRFTNAPTSLIRQVEAPRAQTLVKRISCAKLAGLGWKPEMPLEAGMMMTLEWLRLHAKVAA